MCFIYIYEETRKVSQPFFGNGSRKSEVCDNSGWFSAEGVDIDGGN